MTLIAQYQRFISATTSPKGHHSSNIWSTLFAQFGYQSCERDCVYWTPSMLLSSVTALRGLNDSFSVYPEETHFLGHTDGIPPFWILIGIPPICFHFDSFQTSTKGGAVVSNDGVQHSEDMIGKPKPWHAVQPPKGWEEHMFGLRDRRHSLTPCPSIVNTPMLPSPSLHLDDQIHDEDSAMEEVEENPDNNENEDDQPSSNENKDDQLSASENKDDLPSGSEKEDDQLPSSNDDDKGSDYNENDDKEMESSSDSHGFGASLVMQQWAWCPLVFQSLTISCAQSPLPLSLPPAYKSDDSAHPVGDVVHPCQEGGPIYTRLQKKGKGRAIDAEDIDAANHCDHDTQLLNLKKLGNLSTAALDEICAFVKDVKMMAEELGQQHRQSTCDILITVGFSVRASHTKINEANLFHSWYWATQPKQDGADQNSINNLIMKEYNTLMIGIPKDDFMARREKLKAIYEWTRVDNAKTQFVNWPHSVSPLGPGFKYKKLKAGPLCQLVVPYLQRRLGLLYDGQTDDEEEQDSLDDGQTDDEEEQDSLDDVLEIEIKCWNEGHHILDADPLKGEIALVKATHGTVLQQISDDPEWQKSLKEMDHWQQGTEDVCPIMQDLHHDPSTIPSNVHTREPGPSEPPVPAPQYGVGIYIRIIFQLILTYKRPAQPSSLFPDNKILGVTIQTVMILAHLISHIIGFTINLHSLEVLPSGHCNQFPLSSQGFHHVPS
ncbi:hypothetical protein F5J12DRAFT_783037 [Pisolithus orientalis]|uniref:uncharacterized protein n=1 Tax=Pisolithus orientalis TaxID=936130 RepID=UPI002225986E|nr:uncharacterized protein F5J12DRAFT_783037 [Pisolithus orientalis]KAI6006264.1 hypothetical protein F5J12DRAFT_783037 [Pisolithus orientalis]